MTISTHSAGSRARRADSMDSIAGGRRSADIQEAPRKIVAQVKMSSVSPRATLGSVSRQLVHYPEQRLTGEESPKIVREKCIVALPHLFGHATGMGSDEHIL